MSDESAVENPLDANTHFSATVFDLIFQYSTCYGPRKLVGIGI